MTPCVNDRAESSVKALMDLSGRVAIITGGAGHIGAALGAALAELGASVVVLDVEPRRCAAVAQKLEADYAGEHLAVPCDLNQLEQLQAVPRRVLEMLGRIDILVNCAALVGSSELQGWAVPFLEQSIDTWRRALEVNLTAHFALIQGCTPALSESGHGSIINIASIYGLVGPDYGLYDDTRMGNPAAYAASKGGLLQLTRWLATTLAPRIRVNAISPGGLMRGQPDEFQARYSARTPLQRMARETDLKGAIAYLASDLSSYVTGQNLVVDGGWTAW